MLGLQGVPLLSDMGGFFLDSGRGLIYTGSVEKTIRDCCIVGKELTES